MRSLIPTLLIGLILACPIFCGPGGPAEIGHGSECGGTGGDPGREEGGGGCPEDSDNCVCRGAVQSLDTRWDSGEAEALSPGFLLAPEYPSLHPQYHLTWEGEPTGLAAWGDSLTIRAYLQNFRF